METAIVPEGGYGDVQKDKKKTGSEVLILWVPRISKMHEGLAVQNGT